MAFTLISLMIPFDRSYTASVFGVKIFAAEAVKGTVTPFAISAAVKSAVHTTRRVNFCIEGVSWVTPSLTAAAAVDWVDSSFRAGGAGGTIFLVDCTRDILIR